MKRILLLVFFTVSLLQSISAQTYYKIEHVTGTKMVGTIPITVRGEGDSGVYQVTTCYGPYWLGEKRDTTSAFIYNFGLPVTNIRLQIDNLGQDELVGIYLNNNFYPISSSNLSPSTCLSAMGVCVPYNGFIAGIQNANAFAQVDIHPGYFIDSVKVFYKLKNYISYGGIDYGFYYGTDPHVYVHKPVTDTAVCAGDSLQIRYDVSDIFDTSNIFRVQLSDASGNFANGQIIGSLKKITSNAISCTFPSSLPAGTGYRYRIIASKPADTSADNGKNMRVTKFPTLTVTSNSPVCEGKTLSLKTVVVSDYDSLNWKGPNGFSCHSTDTSFASAINASGLYSATVSSMGCAVSKTVGIEVKPVPFITAIHNNSPLCEGEILRISVTPNDTAGVGFEWSGPNGFTAATQTSAFNNVADSASGTYTAIITQLGCISAPASTVVTIKPKPDVPAITTNSPIEPAQDISLSVPATANAIYAWSGPDGFSSAEQNPVIKEAGNEAEGIYYLTVTLDGCSSSGETQVDVFENALHYLIMPNPSNGVFTIKGNYRTNKITPVRVVNISGQTVYSNEISTPNKFLNMNLDIRGKLICGVYFMKMKLRDKDLNVRLVINQ